MRVSAVRLSQDRQPGFVNAASHAEDIPALGCLFLAVLSVFLVLRSVVYLRFKIMFMFLASCYLFSLIAALLRLAYSACCRC